MAESDEREEEEYVFYRDRPEWSDVTPIPQDDGPNPVVAIAYTDKFRDVYDYLRAVLRADERSERALRLTAEAIDCNPANYTVWHYRRQLLRSLGSDLGAELEYAGGIVLDQPKNYQVWYHRQCLMEWSQGASDDDGGLASSELALTARVLEEDGKNYHAWQHRQWVLKTFALWEGELEYVEGLLRLDLRNNSAWNQRYFVIAHTTKFTDPVVEREIKYTLGVIRKAPNNESPWSYLRGVLRGRRLSECAELRDMCDTLYSQLATPFLVSMLVDIHWELVERGGDEGESNRTNALKMCQQLADDIDPIRKQYWNYVASKIEKTGA